MKKFLLLAGLAAISACGPATNEISVEFKVTDPTEKTVVMVFNTNVEMIQLDENGYGVFTVDGPDSFYADIFYGMNAKKAWFEKGDKAVISFDGKNFPGTFAFDGEKADAVKYLNEIVLTGINDEDYALPFDDFKKALAKKESESLEILKAAQLKNCGSFEKAEAGRIRYGIAASLMMYPLGHRTFTQNMAYNPSEEWYAEIGKYAVESETLADIPEYREYMAEAAHILDAENRENTELYPKLVAEMRYISKNYKNQKVKDAILHHIAAPYIENFGIDNVQDMINLHKTYVKDEWMKADFQKRMDNWDFNVPGKEAPNFIASDIDGNRYSLSSFKGKYVYIDIWATWCLPCRRELPYMKELEAKFEGKNIVFLGLSVDDDKKEWEEMVRSGALSGVQLYLGTGSSFQKKMRIDGIPRFILLDTEGKIINPNMSRPSAESTAETLMNLL